MKKLIGIGRSSIKKELLLITLLFIFIGTAAIIAANTGFISAFSQHRQKRLEKEAFAAVEEAALESKSFYSDMAKIKEQYKSDITIYDITGRMVYSSDLSPFISGWLNSSEVDLFNGLRERKLKTVKRTEEKDGSVFEIRQDPTINKNYLVYSAVISSGSTIEISSQIELFSDSANATTRFVSVIACLTFMLILTGLYLCVRHITKPLTEMNRITGDMAKLDFEEKLPDYGSNELGQLADSINTLSQTLDDTLTDLKDKNEKLRSDIEQERHLEQVRRQFVSNASHELKTPISIIRGYAEGIQSGMNAVEYSDIIIDETVKMNKLVCEMLELSRFESGAPAVNKSVFNAAEFVDSTLNSYAVPAEKLGISLETEVDASTLAYGDAEKLAVCLNNYVSNAFSHADGKKIVRVSAASDGERVTFFVFNTGSPISEEDMPNIWNSFYRADKAHSREEGRFGLGLSIVKAVAEAHGSVCKAENVEDGVTFSFDTEAATSDSTDSTQN